jgi:regulatory protein
VHFSIFDAMENAESSYFKGSISPEKALQKLKHYCGYQERTHYEVKQKLYSLGLSKKNAEQIILQLIEENYLNEERFATTFASGKLRIKGWGKIKITHELRQKKISEYCIRKALNSIDKIEYIQVFKRQADKKWRLLHREKNIFVKKSKWRSYLLQRGFEPPVIQSWNIPLDL